MSRMFIYIIRCDEYYKIGIASRVDRRLSELQVGNPYPLAIEGQYEIDPSWVYSFERHMHSALERWSVRGEWFKLTKDEIAAVKAVCEKAESYVTIDKALK